MENLLSVRCRELNGDILKTYYLSSWVSIIDVTAGSLCPSQTDLKSDKKQEQIQVAMKAQLYQIH